MREGERSLRRGNVLELLLEFNQSMIPPEMAHELIVEHWHEVSHFRKPIYVTSQFTPKKLNDRRERKREKWSNKRSFPLRRRVSSFGHAKVSSCKEIGLIAADGDMNTLKLSSHVLSTHPVHSRPHHHRGHRTQSRLLNGVAIWRTDTLYVGI